MVDRPSIRHGLSKRKQLEEDLAHVNQEMYKRNAELADTNRTLSLLRAIDALVLASHESLQVLATQITRAMVDKSEYSWVAIFSNSEHARFELCGWSGAEEITLKQNEESLEQAYLSGRDHWLTHGGSTHHFHLKNVSNKAMADYLHISPDAIEQLREKLHVNLTYFIKLMAHENLVGVMAIGYPSNVNELGEEDKALLERLSDAVGVAVDNRLLYEENQRVVKQLQASNKKLRELDETKDDFISMASHQLRTPLTSMKGYVSMVIEGDAGKVSNNQKELLEQAFVSSQRMVNLIGDLLNVSRLKTGKFVIDAAPTNLADMIGEEIKQLKESAAAHGLELKYDPPPHFPALMLDITKTRQVIMNFIDNAIYYTPKGGHITVQLVDKPENIEFTVTDDGIGVPKAEQHHLFSKFYRAGNAKKARPDGTGLGLFMAKKVIVAEGGGLIFRSQEGKGSTFGFSFAKAALAPPAHSTKSAAKAA